MVVGEARSRDNAYSLGNYSLNGDDEDEEGERMGEICDGDRASRT